MSCSFWNMKTSCEHPPSLSSSDQWMNCHLAEICFHLPSKFISLPVWLTFVQNIYSFCRPDQTSLPFSVSLCWLTSLMKIYMREHLIYSFYSWHVAFFWFGRQLSDCSTQRCQNLFTFFYFWFQYITDTVNDKLINSPKMFVNQCHLWQSLCFTQTRVDMTPEIRQTFLFIFTFFFLHQHSTDHPFLLPFEHESVFFLFSPNRFAQYCLSACSLSPLSFLLSPCIYQTLTCWWQHGLLLKSRNCSLFGNLFLLNIDWID